MNMKSRPHWLGVPVDVRIVALDPKRGLSGFCKVIGDDFYEDTQEWDMEELGRFACSYEAIMWLNENNYVPMKLGCEDGVYRNVRSPEWFYQNTLPKPAPAAKRRPAVKLTPIQAAVIEMFAA
jgi:hypothetical protein